MADPLETLEQSICEYISTELLGDGRPVKAQDDLLMTGMVDSMGMMWLLSFIEDQAQTTIPPQDVTLENFRTVELMTRYLKGRILK